MKKDSCQHASAKQLGWDADDGQSRRRKNIFEACHKNTLKTAKILQNTAIRGGSDDIRRKAHNDAQYFFNLHKRNRERMGGRR